MFGFIKHGLRRNYSLTSQRKCHFKSVGRLKETVEKSDSDESFFGYNPWYRIDVMKHFNFESLFQTFYKLKDSNHPMINTAKEIISNDRSKILTPGLILMVVYRCVSSDQFQKFVNHHQLLSQACDLINIAFLLHSNLSSTKVLRETEKDFQLCEKLSILGGDLFFSHACQILCSLNLPSVVELMTQSILDISINYSTLSREHTGGVDAFLTFVGWRYTNLILNSFHSSYLVMNQRYNENPIFHEFIKTLTAAFALNVQLKNLKYYEFEDYSGRITQFYPKNYSKQLIFFDCICSYNKHVDILHEFIKKHFLPECHNQIFKLLDVDRLY